MQPVQLGQLDTMAQLSLNSKPKPGQGIMTPHRKYGEPFIKWKHVDGPYLVCRDGTGHWLTYKERIMLYFKLTSVIELNFKYERK